MEESLLDGAADIFGQGSKKVPEDVVRALHPKIGELPVADDFLSRKLNS
ncbi:hypothetical protein RAH32_04295 [Paracoccus sp. WLY502]|nr:hypothetical protein [Paracoccus sp. WLY502]MDQ1899662.1 hypothetical protein [Paracoccus sp. WLY502]